MQGSRGPSIECKWRLVHMRRDDIHREHSYCNVHHRELTERMASSFPEPPAVPALQCTIPIQGNPVTYSLHEVGRTMIGGGGMFRDGDVLDRLCNARNVGPPAEGPHEDVVFAPAKAPPTRYLRSQFLGSCAPRCNDVAAGRAPLRP